MQTRDTLSRNRDKLQRGMTSLQTRLLIHMSAAITHVKSDTTRPVDISERTFKTVVDLREAGVERDGAVSYLNVTNHRIRNQALATLSSSSTGETS